MAKTRSQVKRRKDNVPDDGRTNPTNTQQYKTISNTTSLGFVGERHPHTNMRTRAQTRAQTASEQKQQRAFRQFTNPVHPAVQNPIVYNRTAALLEGPGIGIRSPTMIAKAGGGSKVINTSIDNDVQPRKIPVAGMGSTNVTGNFGHRTTTYSASEIDAALTLMMLRNDTGPLAAASSPAEGPSSTKLPKAPKVKPTTTQQITAQPPALGEHYKTGIPRPAGVSLPNNKAQTLFEWVAYGKSVNWNNSDSVKKLNRWRQQKLRRTHKRLGIKRDGRSNRIH